MSDSTPAIDPQRVEEIYIASLYEDESEIDDRMVRVEGIVRDTGFNPDRLELHREEVRAMLAELPDEFKMSGGGGWSFLNGCQDRHGNLWTGLQMRVGQLFDLGIGLGLVKCQMPREMWSVLPGGVPYYTILDKEEAP